MRLGCRRALVCWLLPRLHGLLLLGVSIRHLLRLLRVLLFELLFRSVVGLVLGLLLVFIVLLLLEFLALLSLLRDHALLLFLVFLIELRVPRVWRGGVPNGSQVARMNRCAWGSGGLRTRIRFARVCRLGIVLFCRRRSATFSGWLFVVVCGSARSGVAASGLFMLRLSCDGRDVPFVRSSFLTRIRPRCDAARAAVEADTALIRDGYMFVVDVAIHFDIHVAHGAIVEKVAVVPTTAIIAFAAVAESIIDPAIEANLGSPVAFVKHKTAATPSPISGRPEEANFRSKLPRAVNPIIISTGVRVPSPVTGRPDIAIAGTNRLLVRQQSRRTETD